MPTIVDKIKLPQQHDRRVKLLDDDKELIKQLYATGQHSLNSLAKQFNVCKKTILLIVNTNSKKKNDDYIKAHWKEYRVGKIHFYKDGKTLVSNYSGWLEKQNGKDIESFELPVNEIKVKRKENLNGEVFAISKGKEIYGNDLIAELYIPAEMLNINFIEYKIEYKTQVRAIYKGCNDIYISSYIKNLDEKLVGIKAKYEELQKKCDGFNLYYNAENTIKNLDELKKLAKQYNKEKNRIENLIIDDVINAGL